MSSLVARIRSANLGIVTLIIVIIAAAVGLDRQRVIERAHRDAANLVDAVTLHVRNDFNVLDKALDGITGTVDPDRLDDLDYVSQLSQTLATVSDGVSGALGFYIIRPDGYLHSYADPMQPKVDLSQREVFTALRDSRERRLFIQPPVQATQGPLNGEWIINVGRRIEHADGAFAGVALAGMSLAKMQENLEPLDVGQEGSVALFRTDGAYILRHPQGENFLGRTNSGGPLFQEHLKRSPSGTYESVLASDRTSRISAYRTIADLPLVTYVGLSKTEVLSDWRDRAIFAAALAVALSGMVIAFTEFLKRTVRREQVQDRERLATLQAIADTSLELMAMDEIGALLRVAAGRARALVPSRRAFVSLVDSADHGRVIRAYSGDEDSLAGAAEHDIAIEQLVRERRQPVRTTAPRPGESPATDPAPGRLAVPLIRQSGDCIGALHLVGRESGEYTAEDEAIAVQLASLMSVCSEKVEFLQRSVAAAEAAQEARREVETVLSSISDGLYMLDNDFCFTYLNDRAAELMRRSRSDVLGRVIWDAFPEARGTELFAALHQAKTSGENTTLQFRYEPLKATFELRVFPHTMGLSVYFRDITNQVELEEKLQQAHKLKAIGQLTGGVAHDFNNLLTVILGNADLLAEYLAENRQLLPLIEMTRSAAERGAELTQQLLAFARRQPLDPRAVDINKLISGFEVLLRRTLGEQIGIELVQGAGLWKANIDTTQLESALLNLAINARDAMPQGGRLTIETMNAYIDDEYATLHEEVVPGQYVLVAVSDTGTGIPKDVLEHVFEPFFTTKEVGKGSGLGLSMIYGFVKQSGGHVKVYSEVGEGTVVKLYLPRAHEDVQAIGPARGAAAPPPRGREFILLVEDDEMVRKHVSAQLADLGYSVIEAANAIEAIEVFAKTPRVDLLFTDIVMPGGVNGRKLADQLRAMAPELKVLFMSGYTENAIVHHGRLDAGVFLLNKPFRKQDLARKIRQVFEAE